MGRTAAQETAETTFSTLACTFTYCDCTVQSLLQVLQLYHRPIHGATTIVFEADGCQQHDASYFLTAVLKTCVFDLSSPSNSPASNINKMEHDTEDFSKLSLKDITENRIELLSKVQEQIDSAITALNFEGDLLSVKKDVQSILQRVHKNVGLIKTSCEEEGTVLNLTISQCNFVLNIS